MPHVKTHRAPWIVQLSLAQGVTAFKCATTAEVEMVLEAGAKAVTWAYPTVNPANCASLCRSGENIPGCASSPAWSIPSAALMFGGRS